jgi:hypothetical protein
MNKRAILASVLVMPLAVAACSGAGGTPVSSSGPAETPVSSSGPATNSTPAGVTERSDGGMVTVEATWNGPAAGASFDVKLDTHSVDLDALDLSNAVLRNDRGESLVPKPWIAAKGGHHREGNLSFDGDTFSFFIGAKWIELTLIGIGDVPERTLHWDIAS